VPAELYLPSLDVPTLWAAIESAAEQARIGLYVANIDPPPRVLYVNRRAAEIAGRLREDMIGQLPWSILRDQDQQLVRVMIERPAGAPAAAMELVVQRPDGREVPIMLATTRMQTAAGLLSFGYFRDISSERVAMEALRRSEARFRLLVQAAPDGVVILKRGVIVFINPKAARLLGTTIDYATDKPIGPFLPDEDAALAEQRIAAMVRDGIELPPSEYHIRADPSRVVEIKSIVCEWDGGPAVLALARDVSERKAIERRLIESDRLAAIGTLAAGVAHEINNPLTYAQLCAQLIGRTLETVELPEHVARDIRDYLADIEHGIKRVASITRALRSFVTAHDNDAAGPVDLDAVVTRALKMVGNDIRHVAELVRESAAVPPVLGQEARLEQVIINLLINAIKALPDEPGRHHTIFVGLAHSDGHVTLTIRDTGAGIPAAVLGRIFDPFFTTREVGHGMGLGLPLSKSIVEAYGGTIDVASIEGVGTTVTVKLRAAAPVRRTEPEAPLVTARRRMRVLVIDDEALIRSVLVRILAPEHDVDTAASGQEAIGLIRSSNYDLILCDVMMPGMSGLEVYRTSAPAMADRFVFMSGGTIGKVITEQLDQLPNGRLAKPFTAEQVLQVVAARER
jgi:PAS domain S-box-containing protein